MSSHIYYQWQGQHFQTSQLRLLSSTFAENYNRTIARHPNKTFVITYDRFKGRQETSFHKFHQDVLRAQTYLRQNITTTGIVTMAGNSYSHLVMITAALLGQRYLALLGPEESPERLQKKLQQLGPHFSLIRQEVCDLALSYQIDSLDVAVCPRALTEPYIHVFTSGSTGYSKIVQQTEMGLLANIEALFYRHHLSQPSVIATPLPIYHVNALEFSFLCSLLSGSTFVLFEKFSIPFLLQSLQQDRIEILSLIPPILRILLDIPAPLFASQDSVKYIVTAATALPKELVREWMNRSFPTLLQGYGLSEAINFSTLMPANLTGDEYKKWLLEEEFPSIGTPLWGNEVFVLSIDGKELGEGEKGELAVRGYNVMAGYKDDHSGHCFANGYLHTGDLGYYRCDSKGNKFFFVCGRLKDTIKRFGETVSLREIDDLLTSHPLLGQHSIAVKVDNIYAGEEVGLVVAGSPEDFDRAHILDFLTRHYPVPLRPKLVAFTSNALRTASGKPLRWQHQSLFKEFEDRIISDEPHFLS